MKGSFYCGGLTKAHMILTSTACLGLSDSACFWSGMVLKSNCALAAGPTWEFANLFEAFGLMDESVTGFVLVGFVPGSGGQKPK